jgi:hypothetical protein
MAVIPYNRVVNVTLTRNDAFPSRRGFGTQLIVTTESVAGKVDATVRTKLYGSIQEVIDDWATTTSAYKAALSAFSQNPRPTQVKIGHVADDGTMTTTELGAQLDLLEAYDNDWYFLTVADTLRDKTATPAIFAWIEARNKLAIIDSNDVDTENPASTTQSVASANKGNFERSAVFYHSDPAMYPAAALAAYMQTRDFDDAGTAYTAAFKNLKGIAADNITSADLTAITGFVPGEGQSEAAGHMANAYIDIGGRNFTVYGSTLTTNVFLDEIHATDWIIARTEEEALGIMLNNARIPFTDTGMQQLAGAPRTVMQVAGRSGLIAVDINDQGDYETAVEITVPSVFDVPESQRKARIAPAIAVRFRYSGAVHYTTINFTMAF